MTFTRNLFNTEFNIKNMDAVILVVRLLIGIFMLAMAFPSLKRYWGRSPYNSPVSSA